MSSRPFRSVSAGSAFVGALLIIGLCRVASGANPNSREPMNPMDVHNLTNAQPTLATANGLFASALKDVQAIGGNPTRVAGKKLSELFAQIRQLRRAALDLQMLGETAGVDYSLRAGVVGGQLGKTILTFKSTPPGQAYANQARQYLFGQKAAQARRTVGQNLQKLLQEKKLDEAYKVLNEALDQLLSLTTMLEQREEDLLMAEFAGVSSSITTGRNTAFRQQAQAALDQLAVSLLPKTQELLQSITATAATLRTAPQAMVGDKTLAGPQCLEAFGDAWKQLQLSAVRCRAVDWAYMTSIPDAIYLQQTGSPRIAEADYTRFCEDFAKALASLIEADAQRAAETDVPTLYVQYLQVLAPLAASTSDDKLQLAVQPALDKLAAKSAAFAEEVKTYTTATHELLRWRQRLAQASAAAAAATFLPSDEAITKFFASGADYRGLLDANAPDPTHAALIGSCPEAIPTASQRALEKPVLVKNIAGLSGGKIGVARYRARHYATIPLPDVSAELVKLQQDLIITAQQPALSLEAAMAADSAQRGNFVDAGGAVKNVYVEGLIPRFAALRPEALQMVALGPLPAEVPPLGFVGHVLVRLDVAPAWLHHKYFFLSLAVTPASIAR